MKLVTFGSVVSEEKSFENVDGRLMKFFMNTCHGNQTCNFHKNHM